ncbi:MAG: class I SAM-dependent methyltransferase [Desulfatitalea sp.]|nr:class I SAM-dependent methyltransferase [Desulfatitalea sp.]NNK00591.1 class I SAM-dependent methyltransferase [Desulfatitalea sp.]
MGLLNDGPGMQARWDGNPTDFFSGNSYSRKDQQWDAKFYDSPRLVQHLDKTARDVATQLYERFIADGMKVLDLMGSWVSHLPKKIHRIKVSRLGMNRTELEHNPVLSDNRVHDLNTDPTLPYASESYDAAICTASVEYLIQPLAVFKDLARVLRPGGVFVVTFSNRWFPTKAIGIWEQIHEFERMGLVMEYFLRSGAYTNLGTYSTCGLPRPGNDRYAGENDESENERGNGRVLYVVVSACHHSINWLTLSTNFYVLTLVKQDIRKQLSEISKSEVTLWRRTRLRTTIDNNNEGHTDTRKANFTCDNPDRRLDCGYENRRGGRS